MKILALADVHGDGNVFYKVQKWKKEHDIDIVVIAGDISHFGPVEWAGDFVKSIVSLGLDVVGVPGNCDPPEVSESIVQGGGVSVHEKRATVKGYSFAGVGGSDPTPFHTLYERDEKEMAKAVDGLLSDLDIFVSHAPPKGKNDNIRNGGNVGSKELAGLLDQWKPRVVITGHIHESRGIVETEDTLYINPGPANQGHGGIVELDKKGKARAVLL